VVVVVAKVEAVLVVLDQQSAQQAVAVLLRQH
jgi:hypothetical protein